MKRYLKLGFVIMLTGFLMACSSAPPKQLVVKEYHAVVLPDEHYEFNKAPPPGESRESVKKLSKDQLIKWQAVYIHKLLGHIETLEHQIQSIQKASLKAQEKLNNEKGIP